MYQTRKLTEYVLKKLQKRWHPVNYGPQGLDSSNSKLNILIALPAIIDKYGVMISQ